MKVRVRETFVSDDDQKVELKRVMTGKVLRVDSQGDAYIKFWEHEHDDEVFRQWVFKTTYMHKLELPGKMVRLKAGKTVSCLNDCMKASECKNEAMSKKEQKS